MASASAQVETDQRLGENAEKAPPQAMIRAFVLPADGATESLQLVLKPQKADVDLAPLVVATSNGAAVFGAGYQPIAPGGVAIELRAGEKVLASSAGTLRPARAYTFVAWTAPPGGWKIKAFSDDPSSPEAADRAVRIINFPAGRQTLLSIDRGAEIKVPGSAVEELRVPPKVIGAAVSVLDPDGGPPALSNVEMDFSTLKSGYIVVVPDNLGRMRPQFIGGGYEEVPELAPEPVVAAAPETAESARQQRIAGARQELEHQETVLQMIKAREAAMGDKPSATLLEKKLEAEKKLAELRKDLEAARSAAPAPGS